ncbi:MAG: hydroxymethylglutaryl-CoA lyase [Alphaproteobacteria bacterium]|jgi:hydroxymethylglutaryl-CoA lyase
MDRIELVEVGPRDGLQNIKRLVPTETKIRLIHALAAAGFKRMELGSFVSPKAIPQMQDMDDVIRGLGPMEGVTGMVLVPNSKGARRAASHGVTDLEMVISMTDGHNNSNVGRPTADSIADLDYLLNDVDPEHKLTLRIGLATSFHCPFEGLTPEKVVLGNIEKMLKIRPGLEFALSDTTGMALPVKVKSLATQALAQFGDDASFIFHGHDTSGFGVANILAGMEAGLRSFDVSVAGLGGCPYAPGASGNIPSEDIVYLMDRMGIETGIDLDKLLDASDIAAAIPGALEASHVRKMPRETALGLARAA